MVGRILEKRLRDSKKSVLLLGPRQVGKSTLMRALAPDLEINLANRGEFHKFTSNINELEQRLNVHKDRQKRLVRPYSVFIDEVQKLPSLLDSVQTILDQPQKDQFRFYLTGSSARKLKRGGANLLPGRVFMYHLGPLAASELNYQLDLRRALEIGFLPEVYLSEDREFQEKLLETYAATYLAEEIQAEALTRNLEGFSRFLSIAAENSGKTLDLTKVSTKAHVSRTSCTRFFEILEDTLVASKVLPFSDCEGADLVRHPKYYFFDLGVLNGILGNFTASQDRIGLLAEHLMLNQLNQSAQAQDTRIEISSFRTRGGMEIDFVVKLRNQIWAIEVKTSSDLTNSDLRGLKEFAKYHSKSYIPVIATVDSVEKKVGDIWILPVQKLLKEMGL